MVLRHMPTVERRTRRMDTREMYLDISIHVMSDQLFILGHAGLVRLLECVPKNLLVNGEFTWPKVLHLVLK